MNYDKLFSLTQVKIFTDLILTLNDRYHQFTIHVNKNILYSSCIYFEKLLTNFKEKNLNEITIGVPNVYVAHDIIMSFYGQKTNSGNLSKSRRLLESIKCYSFLGLDFDEMILDDMEIPEEDFELLLDAIDIIGYNEKTIRLINRNVPKDYDLSKFSKELLAEMLRLSTSYNIISGSTDHSIKIWNNTTGELIKTLKGHSGIVAHICYLSDKKQIISASIDEIIKIWNAENGELIKTIYKSDKKSDDRYNNYHTVCHSSNNKLFASSRCNINIWNADTCELIRTLEGHTNRVTGICFSPCDQFIASSSCDCYIKIWHVETSKLIHTLETERYWVLCLHYSPDGQHIASGNSDGVIKIWNTINGELINAIKAHNDYVRSLCYSYDNKWIISGSDDDSIKIWDSQTCQLINTLEGHGGWVLSVCISPDNKWIASGSSDCSIKIWNAKTGKIIHTLADHTDGIRTVCFSINYEDELRKKIIKLIKN
jgi:WD40 repeat protein